MGFAEFKEFLFLFSRDVREELDGFEWTHGREEVSRWLTTILSDWIAVARSLPHDDQNGILWRIASDPLFIGFWLEGESTDEKRNLLSAAKEVSLAIPLVFPAGEPMENGYFMWWDLLASHIDDLSLAEHCLRILEDLSRHPDERVQYAALHGLGHLQHPHRPDVVDAYIRLHPQVRNDPWILDCREGTVM